MKRDGGIGEPERVKLIAACIIVDRALSETPYLVGSALKTRDFRDVDVRVIMDDDKFNALFGPHCGSDFQILVNIGISAYLSDATGLPVDFQVQRRSDICSADWGKPREPLLAFAGGGDWDKARSA